MSKLKLYVLSLAKSSSVIFQVVYFLTKLFSLKSYQERLLKNAIDQKFLKSFNHNNLIQRGIFKGMNYSIMDAYGSELAPKIIGCYELEIMEDLELSVSRGYKEIIDIGCAEGYYAVGLAFKLPKTTVYAYDIEPKAIKLTKDLALLNGVNNIIYNTKCDADTLRNFKFTGRSLIISDCEGYESQLFNKGNLGNLKNSDLIIELHEDVASGIANDLMELFQDTHQVKFISRSERDPNNYEELKQYSDFDKNLILSECRSGIVKQGNQRWAIIKSKID